MKKVIVFIVLISFIFCQCVQRHSSVYRPTGPVVISSRVGEVIGPEERELYGLFTGLNDFHKAEFQGLTGGGYEIHIETEKQKLIVTNIGPNALMLLRDYLDRHEEIELAEDEFEDKWGIVDYDDLGLPITEKEVELYQTGGSWKSYGCGILTAAGIVSLSFVITLCIAMTNFNPFGPPDPAKKRLANLFFIGGSAIGILSGILVVLGLKVINKKKSLDMVKEARKPRIVDTMK